MGKVPAGVDALCCKIEFRFCTDDSEALDPDIRAFLRYVDGKAAEGAFVQAFCKSDSAKAMQVFCGTCGWHPWEGDGEGLRDSFLRAYAMPRRRTYETDRRTRNMGRLSVCFFTFIGFV